MQENTASFASSTEGFHLKKKVIVRAEVYTAMTVTITALRNLTLCDLVHQH
jgi:hypothetical protein